MAQTSRPCAGCGETILRTAPRGPIRAYCSPDCQPRPVVLRKRYPAGTVCSVEDCGQPRRKREWCASHYTQWHASGVVTPFKHKWATDLMCVVCGRPSGAEYGFRKFCSTNCKAVFHQHGGEAPPRYAACRQCGRAIDVLTEGKNGRRIKSDVKTCRRCRSDRRKHGFSVHQLAERDGSTCRICGDVVDMTAHAPDPFRASVDHITPRARGGTNDPSNLQLAHLWCNQVKRDREGFTLR